jgi:beta-mannosidase
VKRRPLEGWELAAGADEPGAWSPARVPGTVAAALRELGQWGFEARRDFDAEGWWYRCRFAAERPAGTRQRLRFEGLATLAEVSLNGERLLSSRNMFAAHSIEVTDRLKPENELLIRFLPLAPELKVKRPRGRWKTRLVEQQSLRWIRTTLLGRMHGWTPPAAPVGPWRPVWLEEHRGGALEVRQLEARLDGDAASASGAHGDSSLGALASGPGRIPTAGSVFFRAEWTSFDSRAPEFPRLGVEEAQTSLRCTAIGDGRFELTGELRIEGVDPWWPHTHGAQPLYSAHLELRANGEPLHFELGRLGFRELTTDPARSGSRELTTDPARRDADDRDAGFGLRINGVPVFARGACWTPVDPISLTSQPEALRAALTSARDAGMNLLRLSGTLPPESDAFHDLCDELGILVWQDFPFANLDYPFDDATFGAEARTESTQLLRRLAHRPSLAVLCGNSEIEQQAAMLGLPRERWRMPFFDEELRALCANEVPGIPYLPSSPTGGILPFHADAGVTHYYGVGAYLRPVEDARRASVRFASECLAFANVPSDETVALLLGGGQAVAHHPTWKARVPRDNGASWDFEDVRDHYLAQLFGVDPPKLRTTDPARYLELSRVVTGELMASVFGEWRREGSTCRGGLVWTFRDLWPGAGWGVLEADGRPKAPWFYLRRALAPTAVWFSDEGVNGLVIHAAHDGEQPLEVELRFSAWRDGDLEVLKATAIEQLPARDQLERKVEALLGHFADSSYAYRFGPPSHGVSAVELLAGGTVLGRAYHFPLGLPRDQEPDVGLELTAAAGEVRVRTRRFAQAIFLDVPGHRCDDNFFHLAPGMEHAVKVTPLGPPRPLKGTAKALNSARTARFEEAAR